MSDCNCDTTVYYPLKGLLDAPYEALVELLKSKLKQYEFYCQSRFTLRQEYKQHKDAYKMGHGGELVYEQHLYYLTQLLANEIYSLAVVCQLVGKQLLIDGQVYVISGSRNSHQNTTSFSAEIELPTKQFVDLS